MVGGGRVTIYRKGGGSLVAWLAPSGVQAPTAPKLQAQNVQGYVGKWDSSSTVHQGPLITSIRTQYIHWAACNFLPINFCKSLYSLHAITQMFEAVTLVMATRSEEWRTCHFKGPKTLRYSLATRGLVTLVTGIVKAVIYVNHTGLPYRLPRL